MSVTPQRSTGRSGNRRRRLWRPRGDGQSMDSAGLAPGADQLPTLAPSTADPARVDAALATLELTVKRRLDGLLQGNHLGLVPGPGTEPGDARVYVAGDDVRRMDWSVTARTLEPHIRQTVADRELETWLVADLSASLDFGTAGCEKRDLVVAAVASRRPPHPGWRATGSARSSPPATASPFGSRRGAVAAHLQQDCSASARLHPANSTSGERGDLTAAIEQLRRPPRRRVAWPSIVSDFLGDDLTENGNPLNWERPLRAHRPAGHDLLAVEVLDPRDRGTARRRGGHPGGSGNRS